MLPYLFLLFIELFFDLLRKEVEIRNFKLHHQRKDPFITHLSFIDDLIAFLNGEKHTIECFTRVLQQFKGRWGLQVNHQKSHIFYVGMIDVQVKERAKMNQFAIRVLLVNYLGIPLITKRLSHVNYLPLI